MPCKADFKVTKNNLVSVLYNNGFPLSSTAFVMLFALMMKLVAGNADHDDHNEN